jgi:DNA-binding PadR family transcriptional regulator
MWSFSIEPSWQPKKLGPIQLAILMLLGRDSMHVCELMDRLDEHFGEGWSNERKGTIYPTLKSLAGKGFINMEVSPRKGQGIYQCNMTPKGEEVLNRITKELVDEVGMVARYFELVTNHLSDNGEFGAGLFERLSKVADPTEMLLLRSVINCGSKDAQCLERYRDFLQAELSRIEETLGPQKRLKPIKVK